MQSFKIQQVGSDSSTTINVGGETEVTFHQNGFRVEQHKITRLGVGFFSFCAGALIAVFVMHLIN